jgi:hypothetical protein
MNNRILVPGHPERPHRRAGQGYTVMTKAQAQELGEAFKAAVRAGVDPKLALQIILNAPVKPARAKGEGREQS